MSDKDELLAAAEAAIRIGHQLVRICDSLGQPVAGNHIMMALDILSAHTDLVAVTSRDGHRSGHQIKPAFAELEEATAPVDGVRNTL